MSQVKVPDAFWTIPYCTDRIPGVANQSDLSLGANCQVFAYAVLKENGLLVPNVRSSELWSDTHYSKVVTDFMPLDLMLYNSRDTAYGAHVAVYLGDGDVIHLSLQNGKPEIISHEKLLMNKKYPCFVGAKRIIGGKSGNIRNIEKTLLSDNWYTLNKYSYDYQKSTGEWEHQEREAYDRGNGSVILLYNTIKQSVILTRQFRLPTYVNDNVDGMLIEACAGLLEEHNAEDCIKKEAEEETGYKIDKVEKLFEAYMSPGSVTEILHFFVAEYADAMKVSKGGGLDHEQEDIEVLELGFDDAYAMIASGDIRDAKTIMLLQYAKINQLF